MRVSFLLSFVHSIFPERTELTMFLSRKRIKKEKIINIYMLGIVIYKKV